MLTTRPGTDTIAIMRTFDGIVEACRLPDVIDLKTLKVNYEACPENAISVKGYSGARRPS